MTEAPFDRDRILNSAARYLIDALSEQEIAAVPVLTEYGKALQLNGEGMLSLENLVDQMVELPVEQWEEHLQRWAQFAADAAHPDDISQLDVDSIASMIRSRVIAEDASEKKTYARPVVEGLVEILCLDYPNRVLTLDDDSVGQLGLPIDELYVLGRANTQAEPIDERFEEDGIQFVSGDSMFIASKITNIPALLDQLGIDAPDGLLFSIPNRSLLIYKVPTDFTDLVGIANMANVFTPEAGFDNPGGLISAAVYYWSPNGSIESMTGDFDETMQAAAAAAGAPVDEMTPQTTTVIRPSKEFTDRFMKH